MGSQTKWDDDKTDIIPAMSFNFSRRARHLTFSLDYNQEQDDLGIYKVEGRFIFVKFSYWWRI